MKVPLMLLFVLFWVTQAQSADILAVTEELDIYQLRNKSGKPDGYSVEVVRRLGELVNDKIDIQIMPWARTYQTALDTPNVMIFSIARNPQRESLFNWVGKLATQKAFFWAKTEKLQQDIYRLDELKDFHIATTLNTNSDQLLASKDFKQLYRVSTYDAAFTLLLKDRVDLIVNTEIGVKSRAEKHGLEMQDFIPVFELSESATDLYLAFNSKTPKELVEKYEHALQQLKNSGELEEIKRRWNIAN